LSSTPTSSEALSTGSLYGNPSPALFHATPGTITPQTLNP
jgi:hypothetical protein